MWLQEKTRDREIEIHSVKTTENPADILTKHVSKMTLDHLLAYFGMIDYVDDSGNIGSKVVMERTSASCKAALRGKIAATSSGKPQLTVALLLAQQVEVCDCNKLEFDVGYYKILLSIIVGLLVLLGMVYVATNKDPEERVVTYVYVDGEDYHESQSCARLHRRLSYDTSIGIPLPRFRCVECWQPRGVAEERRRLDMMAAERDRLEYEEAEARHRAWENGEDDEDENLFGPSPASDAEHDPFDDLADAYRQDNVRLALAQREIDVDTASYEHVLGNTGQY
jgi:hypothetical protein